jgi:hypothetical protein
MGAPAFLRRTVEDAAIELIRAAEMLGHHRTEADRIVADLETCWAVNRAARAPLTPQKKVHDSTELSPQPTAD